MRHLQKLYGFYKVDKQLAFNYDHLIVNKKEYLLKINRNNSEDSFKHNIQLKYFACKTFLFTCIKVF